MFAKFSPNQKWVAYVCEFNIYIESVNTGELIKLTSDGTRDIINGTFDWAYEEEFSCKDGFRWSPDGKSIAYWQLDASEIKNFLMINYTDSIYSHTIPLQYPKVGEDPSSAKVGVVNISTNETVWMKVPGDQKQHYIPRMQWVGNSVLVQQLTRKQNDLKFWMCDSQDGTANLFFNKIESTWIDIMNPDLSVKVREMDDLFLTDNLKSLLFLSEKNGWKRVTEILLLDGAESVITYSQFDIAAVYHFNKSSNDLYVCASPGNATQRYLSKLKIHDGLVIERITPKRFSGINKYNISPNGKYAIHEHSNSNTPNTFQLISLPDHKVIKEIVKNESYKEEITKLNLPKYEFFKVKTEDGVTMDGKILKPLNFDPQKNTRFYFMSMVSLGAKPLLIAGSLVGNNYWHRRVT